jgi:hypothetical protein
MAKLYRKKRVSNAYSYRLEGMTQWMSAYEVGHVLYQARLPLPMDAPLHMQQGYGKAAKEQDLVWVADFRRLYRLGKVVPLPDYRYMVKGITPFIFDGKKGQYPLKRGQSERLPMVHRVHAAEVRKRYVKLAFG